MPLSLVLAALSAATTTFDPPADLPLTLRLEQTRSVAAAARTWSARYGIRFHRADQGWTAELTLLGMAGGAKSGPESLFRNGLAALKGVAIKVALDEDGTVRDVPGADALWNRLCDAIAATRGAASTHAKTVAQTTRGLPAAQRATMLADPVAKIVASHEDVLAKAGTRSVTLTAIGTNGAPVPLPGSEMVSSSEKDDRRIVDVAHGTIPAAAKTPSLSYSVENRRTVDTLHGLVRLRREETVAAPVSSGANPPPRLALHIVETAELSGW